MRPSTLLFHVTQHLLYTKWRDPGEEPKLHLFGQLKRITKQWLDTCLVCKGDTYPGLLMYQELADMACDRITAGITRAFLGERPIKALLDPYNPTGSTRHVRFNTSKTDRWETSSAPLPHQLGHPRQRLGGRVLPRGRVAPAVRAYVKNHNLGLEVPYRFGSRNAEVPPGLHRPGRRRPRRRRPPAPGRRDQGLPAARTRKRRSRRWRPTGCRA